MNVLLRMALAIAVIALFACSESEKAPVGKPASQPSEQPPGQTPEQTPTTPPEAGDPETPAEPAPDDPAALRSRGQAVYSANCIACHNPDPSMDGGIGPAIAGSSLALIEARVMRNEYPEGYTPKRDTRAMIALPYLENDLAAIVTFLAR